jgi:uncharacterized protein YhaN
MASKLKVLNHRRAVLGAMETKKVALHGDELMENLKEKIENRLAALKEQIENQVAALKEQIAAMKEQIAAMPLSSDPYTVAILEQHVRDLAILEKDSKEFFLFFLD